MPNKKKQNEAGNILLYILGAIALLGLLIIAVKGSSTPGSNINEEELMIRVAEIQQYGAELEQAVTYIMQNGFSETDIRFAHPDANSAYGDITDNPQRQVFSRNGGGATYRQPPSDIQTTATDWVFSGENVVNDIGSSINCNGVNSSCVELIALLMNVTKDFCILINEKNNITNASGDPPQDDGHVAHSVPFVGSFNHSRNIIDTTFYLAGKMEGCFEGDTTPPSGTYHYYRVLLAR